MRKNKKLLLGGLSVLTLVAAGSGAVSTFAWYQASASANLNTVDAKSGQVGVDKPEITVTSVANITVTISLNRVTGSDSAHAGTDNLHPVIYGKLKTTVATGAKEIVAYNPADHTAYDALEDDATYTYSEGWHYAINSAAGDKLYWDADANTYAGYNPTSTKENYAIYKVTWTSSYTTDQAAAFNSAHGNGMRNVVSFDVKDGADASTTIWTANSNPTNYTSKPGTKGSFNLDIASLTGTSANGTLGYVMVYCLGTAVTDDVTVGVTATPGGWNDIGA